MASRRRDSLPMTTTDEYIIKFHRPKPNSEFWEFGIKEHIILKVPPETEKCNHDLAERVFKMRNPTAVVDTVTYV